MADSQIRLQPTDPDAADTEVVVGWDGALQTYYGQVFNGDVDDNGEEILLVDVGNDLRSITDPNDAIDAVRAHAEIPDDLAATMAASRDATSTTLDDLRFDADLADESDAVDIVLGHTGSHCLREHDRADEIDEIDGEDTALRSDLGYT